MNFHFAEIFISVIQGNANFTLAQMKTALQTVLKNF